MSEKIRKIDIRVHGICAWSEKEFDENLIFFKAVADKIEKYLQSVKTHDPKEIKINFTPIQSGRIDKYIFFETHDEDEYPNPPIQDLFPKHGEDTLQTKTVKEIITEDVEKRFNGVRRVSFGRGPLSTYSSSKLVLKEEDKSSNPLLMEVTPASTDIVPEKFEESN